MNNESVVFWDTVVFQMHWWYNIRIWGYKQLTTPKVGICDKFFFKISDSKHIEKITGQKGILLLVKIKLDDNFFKNLQSSPNLFIWQR